MLPHGRVLLNRWQISSALPLPALSKKTFSHNTKYPIINITITKGIQLLSGTLNFLSLVWLLFAPSLLLRRAHLKECFETLKKNIPNVDEKKTSNLSVLRSALRYIQVSYRRSLTRTNKKPSCSLSLYKWPLVLTWIDCMISRGQAVSRAKVVSSNSTA